MENLQYYYNEEEEIFYFSWEGDTSPQEAFFIWKQIIDSKADLS